eukprot:12236866-Prorocentrum_lima.AAC.1
MALAEIQGWQQWWLFATASTLPTAGGVADPCRTAGLPTSTLFDLQVEGVLNLSLQKKTQEAEEETDKPKRTGHRCAGLGS